MTDKADPRQDLVAILRGIADDYVPTSKMAVALYGGADRIEALEKELADSVNDAAILKLARTTAEQALSEARKALVIAREYVEDAHDHMEAADAEDGTVQADLAKIDAVLAKGAPNAERLPHGDGGESNAASQAAVEGEREAFEKWALTEHMYLERTDDGEYEAPTTANAWAAWQARATQSAPQPAPDGWVLSVTPGKLATKVIAALDLALGDVDADEKEVLRKRVKLIVERLSSAPQPVSPVAGWEKKAAEEMVAAARRPEWGKNAHRDIEHATAILQRHNPPQRLSLDPDEQSTVRRARTVFRECEIGWARDYARDLLAIIDRLALQDEKGAEG